MKLYPTAEQKALFEKAAKLSKPLPLSATAWMITAGLEKAERDGVAAGRRGTK